MIGKMTVFEKNLKRTVDTFEQVCRMRISFEGNATEAGQKSKDNRLKVLKKMSFRILQKAVDRVAIRCRMRSPEQAVSRVIFRRFPETENNEK